MKSRKWIALPAGLTIAALALSGCGGAEAGAAGAATTGETVNAQLSRAQVISSPKEALELLQAGNRRYVDSRQALKELGSDKRQELSSGQHPFAVVVSCSDSRVPPELIFDQGLGDIFVVRVAGNVIDEVALGSIEYAVEHLHTPLVVVLGHEKCGAVKATVESGSVSCNDPGSICAIVNKIKPSVDKVRTAAAGEEELVEASVTENVKATLTALETSPILKEKLASGAIETLGAKYDLDTGQAEWL